MDAKKTGALIAERRKALGLTQKELAGRLMVSDKAVSKWETGAGYPEVTLLPLLAETLGITVDELLAGELRADAPEPEPAAPQPSDIQRAYAAKSWRTRMISCCLRVSSCRWWGCITCSPILIPYRGYQFHCWGLCCW